MDRDRRGRYVFLNARKPAIRQQATIRCPSIETRRRFSRNSEIKLARPANHGNGTRCTLEANASGYVGSPKYPCTIRTKTFKEKLSTNDHTSNFTPLICAMASCSESFASMRRRYLAPLTHGNGG